MTRQVLVVCKADRQLVSLEPDSLEVRWRAALSGIGHEVTASNDGTLAYVPLYGTGGVGHPGRSGDGLDVVDLRRGVRVDTLRLPRDSRPHFAAWGQDGQLYVTAEGIRSVLDVDVTGAALDGGRTTLVRKLATHHDQSHMLAVAPDGSRVYTADVRPGTVTEIDVTSAARRVLELVRHLNRIALSADGREAYTADQDEPRLAVVDTATMTLDRWIPLPSVAFGTAVLGDGRLAMALRAAQRLAVLDLRTGDVTSSVAVPGGPQRVVLDATGSTAYVTCSPGDVVAKIDLGPMTVQAAAVGAAPDGLAVTAIDY